MRRFRIIVALCVGAIAVGGVVSFDYFHRMRQNGVRESCAGSLIRINLTKLVYAHYNGLTNGAVIPDDVIWRENQHIERCGTGGHYSINPVGVYPSCSYTGVVRWQGRLRTHDYFVHRRGLTNGLSQ